MSICNNSTDGGEKPPSVLPGPKKKQAEALAHNIRWLADTFGSHRIGFLTLTCGNRDANGRFVKVQDRAEASRRFNSLLTHVIRPRYRCGVVVSERHKDGGLHFHLIVTLDADIATGFRWDDFDRLQGAVKRRERKGWRAVQVGASPALSAEWEFWRERAEAYGFGRAEMLPIRKNGEAVGRYVAKYVTKSWEFRREEDKGARLVRYFGNWNKRDIKGKMGPRYSARFGGLTPRARAWRECAKQVQLATGGAFTPATAQAMMGQRWAWHFTRQIQPTIFLAECPCFNVATSEGLAAHNQEAEDWQGRKPVWERGVEWWTREPDDGEVDLEQQYCRAENNRLRQRDRLLREELEAVETLSLFGV